MAKEARRRPVIGVAPRWEGAYVEGTETIAPSEAVADVFMDAIIAAGGLPLTMPLTEDEGLIREMVDLCDGFAIPGGQDVDPRLWGDDSGYDESLLVPTRDAFEVPLIRHVIAAHKPLLGTCRGAQILNVALGGTLCMDVPSIEPREGMVLWRHTGILNDVAHPVEVLGGTVLSQAVGGRERLQVNSAHHCCVDRLGEGLALSACATDGVPECIELTGERFCVGVQWHPEYTWTRVESDFLLWKALVAACDN